MYSANAQYQFTPDVMAYVSYSTGFKAGGFSANTADTFAPETVKSYETGLKAQFFNRRLTTNLALFYSDYSNLQDSQSLVAPSGAVVPSVANVASSPAKGVEFSARLQATRGLTLSADVAYLDAHYGHYEKPPCTPMNPGCSNTSLDGAPTTFAPKWSGSTSANFELPINPNLELRLNGTLYFTSSYYEQSAISDLVKQDTYAKIDLRAALAIDDGKWEIALIGKNVTDKTTAGFRSYALGAVGTAVALADRPRSIALQLNAKW
jgi:outer membrane receptor protein involved in Fe transport